MGELVWGTHRGAVRASDAERERTVAELRWHYACGRLSPEELEERVARACSARTAGTSTAP